MPAAQAGCSALGAVAEGMEAERVAPSEPAVGNLRTMKA